MRTTLQYRTSGTSSRCGGVDTNGVLYSAGSDGSVVVWNLAENLCDDGTHFFKKVAVLVHHPNKSPRAYFEGPKGDSEGEDDEGKEPFCQLPAEDDDKCPKEQSVRWRLLFVASGQAHLDQEAYVYHRLGRSQDSPLNFSQQRKISVGQSRRREYSRRRQALEKECRVCFSDPLGEGRLSSA